MHPDVNILKNMYCNYMAISAKKQAARQKKRPALPKISRKQSPLPVHCTGVRFSFDYVFYLIRFSK